MAATKRRVKMSFLSCSDSDLKCKFLKYEKSEKLLFEISVWIKNGTLFLFYKNRVVAPLEVKNLWV